MSKSQPLSCSRASRKEVLEALISGQLDSDSENRLLEHLRTCPFCLSKMAAVVTELQFPDRIDPLLEI